MADLYGDSSALVKRHIREVGTAWFSALVHPTSGNRIITAQISQAEVYRALNRRVRDGILAPADYLLVRNDFAALCLVEYQLIGLGPGVLDRARNLLERHALRAYDAVQLATALIVNETFVAANVPPLVFLSADNRLIMAAQAEGLAVVIHTIIRNTWGSLGIAGVYPVLVAGRRECSSSHRIRKPN